MLPKEGEVVNKMSTLPVVDNAANIVIVIGIDLAKSVFAIPGTTRGQPRLSRCKPYSASRRIGTVT